MRRRLRIAIATAGRFHVLDLARELHKLGHEVKFYSYVPLARARHFGLPAECHVPLLPYVAAILGWERFAPRVAPKTREATLYKALNWAVMARLQPCDVFHCMSGIYLEAAEYARKRFGARIWLVRGSRHILSQDEVLACIPGATRPSPLAIRRELAGYRLADRIDIPSKHVEESFRSDPDALGKLFRNPYGVDTGMFRPLLTKEAETPITFLMVGSWSLQKGVDILVEAVKRLSCVRVLHVGGIVDAAFPHGDPQFVHHDAVDQTSLISFYGQAQVLVLPSRQDGFGVVLSQALACGLPVICTDRTGGSDLMYTRALASRITVIPSNSAEALANAMESLCDRLTSGDRFPSLTSEDLETLTWSAYARRYSEQLAADFGEG